jgi:hypothetical protein
LVLLLISSETISLILKHRFVEPSEDAIRGKKRGTENIIIIGKWAFSGPLISGIQKVKRK